MTRRRWVLHDLNSRFNCLNPRYNVGTPSFAPVDDYADENPKERDDAASASDRHEAWDRDPAEAHAGALRDDGAEQQYKYDCDEGVVEQDEGFHGQRGSARAAALPRQRGQGALRAKINRLLQNAC